ncbi:MAG: hypothetical protein KBA79_03055 [Candidatus Cloacimonetes bacterium]|nr:hypothetical protein [Candidatus Cloacimonadota bacterium]
MKFLEILSQVRSALSKGAGADLSFGKATQLNDVTVIPVARISMAFGGGGGSSPVTAKKASKKLETQTSESLEESPEAKSQVNEGGGGGGQISTTPVGIYTIKGDKVKFYPLLGVREILLALGLVSILWIKIIKLRRYKRK